MVRLICVGLGGMGFSDWKSAAKVKGFKLVAGVDVDENFRRRFEDMTGCATFADFSKALSAVAADAALIAVPDALHARFTILAMKAGLDVICEKPLAETLAAARRMHATAERCGKMLMVHHQLRWRPPLYSLRRLIEKGTLGQLRQLEFDMYVHSGACLKGYRSQLPQLMLRDLAIHHFDLMRYFTGEQVKQVFVRSWPSNEVPVQVSATTSVYAILEMTGPVTVSYRSKMRAITDPTGYEGRVVVTGSKGVATVNDGQLVLQTFAAHKKQCEPRVLTPKAPRYGCWESFARAIRTREPTLTASGDNLKSLQVMFAAIRSAESGRVVTL